MSKLNITVLAITENDRAKGLMHTNPLKENECAFFIFDQAANHSFWNKNVGYAIDVAFFNSEGRLVSVASLEAEQQSPVRANTAVKYVIETSKDWFRQNDIGPGTSLWELIDINALGEKSNAESTTTRYSGRFF